MKKPILITKHKFITSESDAFLYERGVREVLVCRNDKLQEFVVWKMSNGMFNQAVMATVKGGKI